MVKKVVPGGLLVVIEGIDGSGKTVLADTLCADLAAADFAVVRSKEPTDGPWGRQLRASAKNGRLPVMTEVDLLVSDRRHHVQTVITPALAKGAIVLLDRYFPSMIAYQGAAGVCVDALMTLNAFAPRPDLLLLLDLDPQMSHRRIQSRGDTPNAFEDARTLQRCRAIFLELQLPNTVTIDASQSVTTVAALALMQIQRQLERRGHPAAR